MGLSSHDYLWILSPFDYYPYDRICHVILGFITGYYYKNLIILLILYQLLNMVYSKNRSLYSRLPSILEYIVGFLLALVITEIEKQYEDNLHKDKDKL